MQPDSQSPIAYRVQHIPATMFISPRNQDSSRSDRIDVRRIGDMPFEGSLLNKTVSRTIDATDVGAVSIFFSRRSRWDREDRSWAERCAADERDSAEDRFA